MSDVIDLCDSSSASSSSFCGKKLDSNTVKNMVYDMIRSDDDDDEDDNDYDFDFKPKRGASRFHNSKRMKIETKHRSIQEQTQRRTHHIEERKTIENTIELLSDSDNEYESTNDHDSDYDRELIKINSNKHESYHHRKPNYDYDYDNDNVDKKNCTVLKIGKSKHGLCKISTDQLDDEKTVCYNLNKNIENSKDDDIDSNNSQNYFVPSDVDDETVEVEADAKNHRSTSIHKTLTPLLERKENDSVQRKSSKEKIESSSTSILLLDDSESDSEQHLLSPTPFSPRNPTHTSAASQPSPATQFQRNRVKVPIPPLPLLNSICGKLYPDLRHQFILALMEYAKLTRRASHQRNAFDTTLRAIAVLSLRLHPIRTADAATHIKGIGRELLNTLKDAAKNCKGRPFYPTTGKLSSVASAALVALYQTEEEERKSIEHNVSSSLEDGKFTSTQRHNRENTFIFCTMEIIIRRINRLLDPRVGLLDRPVDYYLNKNNLDPGWGQVRKLCSTSCIAAGSEGQLIKERRKKGTCASGVVFELTNEGREVAQSILRQLEVESSSVSTTTNMGPLRQLAANEVNEEYGNITMSMDFREGGGSHRSLHKMCDLLDEHCVPYVVRELKISDYVFFVGNKLAPILIERKSAEDVAGSIADGRWERQKRNMRRAQYVLGGGESRKCQICFIIEGDASRKTVHGGNVGRVSWDQSLENVERAINKLPKRGFSVMKSKSVMGSMLLLAQIARDVAWKYKNGSIDASMTYEEFTNKLKEVPAKTGDPLDPATEREHMYPAAPVPDAATVQTYDATQQNGYIDSPNPMFSSPSLVREDGSNENESNVNNNHADTNDYNDELRSELQKKKTSELKEMCKERDEKQSGNKDELIARLLKPRKPEILISRSRRGQYVPRVPSCNAALMVALLLNHRPGMEGITKESLMMLAEENGISKESMGGEGGWYDGWAGMKDLLRGDPALVCMVKRRYSLTTQPTGSAGLDIAKALHIMAHREGLCRCGAHL